MFNRADKNNMSEAAGACEEPRQPAFRLHPILCSDYRTTAPTPFPKVVAVPLNPQHTCLVRRYRIQRAGGAREGAAENKTRFGATPHETQRAKKEGGDRHPDLRSKHA